MGNDRKVSEYSEITILVILDDMWFIASPLLIEISKIIVHFDIYLHNHRLNLQYNIHIQRNYHFLQFDIIHDMYILKNYYFSLVRPSMHLASLLCPFCKWRKKFYPIRHPVMLSKGSLKH